MLLVEVDGDRRRGRRRRRRIARPRAARRAATDVRRARRGRARGALALRRGCLYALRTLAPLKFNQDVVVPRGRVPDAVRADREPAQQRYDMPIPSFGHAGDGNIHVNIMVDPDDAEAMRRAHAAERDLFEGVVALGGSISGEHGIGFTKAPYLGIELSDDEIALMSGSSRPSIRWGS